MNLFLSFKISIKLQNLKSYVTYLKDEKRYSLHTVGAYEKDIEQFFSFLLTLEEVQNWGLVESRHLRSWVVHLMQKNRKATSIQRKISALKGYHKFLLQNQKTINRPFPKVLLPKTAERLPIYIEEKQMAILQQDLHFSNGFKGWRDYLLIELLYNTGMRRSELIHLHWSDIDWDNRSVLVLGKGNKKRWIPFGEELQKTLASYRKILDKEFTNKQNSYIFVTDKGQKMYPKFVYNKVKHYLSFVTTNPKRSPHVLRHSFATHLSNNGADLNAIKKLLGHTNLAATQVYMHNSIEQLKKIYNQAHPKAKTNFKKK